MSFRVALVILTLYYLRPQDWIPGMAGWSIMKPIALVGMLALLNRPQGFNPRDLVKTPIDWAVLLYTAYVVLSSPSQMDTFKAFIPLTVYYILTAQAINSSQNLLIYLKWWATALLILAGLGVASVYGLDLTGAREVTEGQEGRLALGTWMHNNPNSLGHSVITAIPMAYVLWFQRQSTESRVRAILLISLAIYCVYLTQSRGAFVVGAGAIVLTLSFGKPKFVQVLLVSVALIVGSSALAILPRMGGDLRSDEGVQGRMLAWAEARTATRADPTGEGYNQFEAYISWRQGNRTLILKKATHGSYIRVGADLGYCGLFFYLAVIWVCVRTMLLRLPSSGDPILEKARGVLFLLLATSAVSGWMIDRSYHLEYFLLAGAVSAYHRLLVRQRELEATQAKEAEPNEDTLLPGVGFDSQLRSRLTQIPSRPRSNSPMAVRWLRPGIIDACMAVTMTWLVIYTWDRILQSFLY